ncbi:MAG: hypothetical protein CV090_05855 [Nitrospira sp. WS238]|nr:hypothetical protein [Nitrospira sp. WS238]
MWIGYPESFCIPSASFLPDRVLRKSLVLRASVAFLSIRLRRISVAFYISESNLIAATLTQ